MENLKLTRSDRERQLQAMLASPAGKAEVERLFLNCFPFGQMPPVGTLIIQTILNKEFPGEDISAS